MLTRPLVRCFTIFVLCMWVLCAPWYCSQALAANRHAQSSVISVSAGRAPSEGTAVKKAGAIARAQWRPAHRRHSNRYGIGGRRWNLWPRR